MKLPAGAARSLAKTFSKTKKITKSIKPHVKKSKSKTKDFAKHTGDKAKKKYKSFTDAGSGEDNAASHRQKQKSEEGKHSKHPQHATKKVKSAPVLSAGYSEAEESESSIIITDSSYVETDSSDADEGVSRRKQRRNRRHTMRTGSTSEYGYGDKMAGGGAQYKFFLVLLFLLAVTSVIGLIFVPLGDQIAKRYSWYAYESKVSTLIVTFGLAAASGVVLVLLALTQLGKLMRNEGTAFLIGIIVVGLIFSLVALICSWTQNSNLEAVFGEEFENLLPMYQQDLDSKMIVDRLQIEFECCGIDSYTDWEEVEVIPERGMEGFTPFSCCNMKSQRPCLHERVDEENPDILYRFPDDLTVHENGCRKLMQQYYAEFITIAISLSGTYLFLEVVMFMLAFLSCKQPTD